MPGHPEWSKWAAIIVLIELGSLLVYEFWALHEPGDSWPTITALTVALMKRYWWALVAIIAALITLTIHFIMAYIRAGGKLRWIQ